MLKSIISEFNAMYNPPKTIKSFQKEFIFFFKKKNLKKLELQSFIVFLEKNGNAPATINAKLIHLCALLRFAGIDPPKFKFKKIVHNKIETLSRASIAHIYRYCRQNNEKELLKACRIALNTGARIDNILNIKAGDIESGYIRFYHNKTNRPYSVPINNKIKRLMVIFQPFKLNYQALYYRFNKMKKILKLNDNITIHSMRHTFTTALLNKNVAITTLQTLLNHKNIATTMIYAHLKNKTLENAINLL